MSNFKISIGTGIYLGAIGFANVNNINFSFGKENCFEVSLNIINQLSDLYDNNLFEYCHYGTNKYRLETTLGYKYNNLNKKNIH